MNVEKKKQKELAKMIKAAERSLSYLSDSAKKDFDVQAVQLKDHVFYCGNQQYRKIYMLHPASLGNKSVAFIRTLTDRFEMRFRFTSCAKNNGEKLNAVVFLTVTFGAENYFTVRKDIAEFERILQDEICSYLGITVSPCSVENILTYIHYNCTGEMKEIEQNFILGKGHAENLFKGFHKDVAGLFELNTKYGVSFHGKQFWGDTSSLNEFMFSHEGSYFSVVDFQKFGEKDQELYELQLKSQYGLLNDVEKPGLLNLTYLLTVLENTEEKRDLIRKELIEYFDEKKAFVMPVVGREKDAVQSSLFLGMKDFRSMHIASNEIIGGLLL